MGSEKNTEQTTTTLMDPKHRWFLIVYLLVVTVLSCWVVYSLWSAPQSTEGKPPKPDCTKLTSPTLTNLYPDQISLGSQVTNLLSIGCKLPERATVRFNGAQRAAIYVNDQQISVRLASADLPSANSTAEVVLSDGSTEIGRGFVTIIPPSVYWHFVPFAPWTITYEVQLLLLVLFVGVFASCIYALKSLADYEGDKKLYETWFTYYLIQPFEGGGAAFLLYALIRGGLLTGTGVDMKAENRFGIVAIAGLAGAFSDTAFLKLREVFLNLLKPKDDRGGKLTLRITTASLPDGIVGKPYHLTLQTSRGTAPITWSVSPDLPEGLKLEARTGVINGTPVSVLAKKQYKFTVTDTSTPPESATVELTLEIKATSDGVGAAQPDSDAIDGCDIDVKESTSDEDLPPTEGGVA